ncbi:unnamed protein product [Heligmosomoides polygyrus]|uniref:Transposase n=1 Tax=Heligmosomoides polygyrus TaxID=6339 RepID=A0A183FDW7_HELPZ|nr:unnamed protein product [Heligmosomoides polygyrus]
MAIKYIGSIKHGAVLLSALPRDKRVSLYVAIEATDVSYIRQEGDHREADTVDLIQAAASGIRVSVHVKSPCSGHI